LFEEHTCSSAKAKRTSQRIGRLVRIDEVENGIVSHYDIASNNMAISSNGSRRWKATNRFLIKRRTWRQPIAVFGARPMKLSAEEMGVQRVVLPGRGRLSSKSGSPKGALVPPRPGLAGWH